MPTVITVDGPSGVGKGTLSYRLAQRLGWHLLDSGAIYRVLAWGCLQNDLTTTDSMVRLAQQLPVQFQIEHESVQVYWQQHNITQALRNEQCGAKASEIATLATVRQALLQRQRDFYQPPGLVADGRDMGTVVFPQATMKLFLTASAQVRAKRRLNQLKAQGFNATLTDLTKVIADRDTRDRQRVNSPLVPAHDALMINTSDLTADQVFDRAWQFYQQRINC